jgi:hypothetical protein
MFDFLENLIPGISQIKLSVTAVLWILGALILAAIIGFGVYEAHEVKTLEQQAGQAAATIKGLQTTNQQQQQQINALKSSGQVNNVVSTNDVNQKNAAQTNTNQIVTNEQQQESAIVQQYQPQGPSQVIPASDAQAEENDLNTTQINAMWQSYCQAVPASTTGCAGITTNTTSPAAPVAASAPSAQVGPIAMK